MMAKYLEDIFNECLERMRRGDSMESCLSSYPDYAHELEELLSTVLNVRQRSSIVQPRPDFKARARARFMSEFQHARQFEQPKKPAILSLQRAWIPALASILILLFGSMGTAAASTNAMPDQPLYHVKLATEQVRLTFTFPDTEKVKYNVELAENRSQEIVYMAEQGDTGQLAVATEKLLKHLHEATLAIERIEEEEVKNEAAMAGTSATPLQPESTTQPARDSSKDIEPQLFSAGGEEQTPLSEEVTPQNSTVLKELVRESIARNITALDSALQKVPEAARPALQKVIEVSQKLAPVLQERPQMETTTEPAPAQPEKIDGARPSNQDTQSTIESKEPGIKKRPNTDPGNSTTSPGRESEK